MESIPWWEEEAPQGDAPVLLSMLEHFAYCPRQCALIHLEQVYDENVFTLKGSAGHERVDEPQSGESNGTRFERALPLFSHILGLSGKADLIEFPGDVPYPVEYKHGSKSGRGPSEIQLCGQALCLEEMFHVAVPKGALYSITSHRRREVAITEGLRENTRQTVVSVREMLRSETLPAALNDARCTHCSLIEVCNPNILDCDNRDRLERLWEQCFVVEDL
jgi:CRISPR-associated exonuclease Cas4